MLRARAYVPNILGSNSAVKLPPPVYNILADALCQPLVLIIQLVPSCKFGQVTVSPIIRSPCFVHHPAAQWAVRASVRAFPQSALSRMGPLSINDAPIL